MPRSANVLVSPSVGARVTPGPISWPRVPLGNRTNLAEAQAKGVASRQVKADQFAANVLPVIRQIQGTGATTLAELAEALNARGIAAAQGGRWHPMSVRGVLMRGAGR